MLIPLLLSLIIPSIHANVFCFDPSTHHMDPPLGRPTISDCEHVADDIYDEDTRRPPQVSTFGRSGDVDFIVPRGYHHKTCRAAITIRASAGDQVGRTSITEFALAVMAIETYCRQKQPPGFGGAMNVAGNMLLTLWGDSASGESGGNVSASTKAVEALWNGTGIS